MTPNLVRPDDAVALYLRVSSPDQEPVGQERELSAETRRRGWNIESIYREKITATGKGTRAEYERLLREARRPGRPWRHLLVWAFDRFSREETFTRATATILELEQLGICFHSLNEPMLDTPEDGRPNLGRDVLLALLPVIASFESKRRSERVHVAMQEINAGRRRTRSSRPPRRPRRLTPEKVEQILRLRATGMPWTVVAQQVGLPSGTCRFAHSAFVDPRRPQTDNSECTTSSNPR